MSNSKNRRLAAILFADIVGYTTLMQNNEPQALASLQKFKNSLNIEVPTHKGEIIQYYGDGCLCVFNSSVDAVTCAKKIQSIFQSEPKVPVRIGLHAGDIIFRDGNVFGDAVNITSRIESMGIPGSVLISSNVRNQIKNQPTFKLKSLGKFEFKNVQEGMTIYALANEGFALPKQGEIKGKIKSSKGKTNWVLPAMISTLFLLSFGIWKWNTSIVTNSSAKENSTISASSIAENSLAVLPFTNISPNAENQYFCDGMHDDLLTHLSKIGSMKVISRTSVLRFKETQLPIPDIAKMLEVANILEGSVRRVGNQLRINVQLIKAETDEHLWSEMYDRELTATNIFDIQTEIAQKIAAVLKTTITTLQQQALAELPTENLAAYEAYLKARQIAEKRNSISLNQAKTLLEEAIQLDESFALAYIDLGTIYMLLNDYAGMDKQVSITKARENLKKGMALNDNLAEAYALNGLVKYDENNLAEAVEAFEKAIAINPNYETTYHWYALVVEKGSRDLDKAFTILKKALQINPLSPSILFNIGRYYQIQKDYPRAIQTFKKGIALEPAYPTSWNNLSTTYALLGQLDSSAIYSLKGVQQNQASDLYLDVYLSDLLELGMDQELQEKINTIQPKNKIDSLTILRYTYLFAESQKEFRSNLSLVNQPSSIFNSKAKQYFNKKTLFYLKDYQQYIKNYAKEFANEVKANNFIALSGRGGFQEYIFSLHKKGQTNKAEKLWTTNKDKGLEEDLGKFEYPEEERNRLFLNSRHYIIDGQPEKAIQMINKYFEGGYYRGWRYFEIDPIFESIQSHPEFIKTINEVKAKVATQRASVRAYIKGFEK